MTLGTTQAFAPMKSCHELSQTSVHRFFGKPRGMAHCWRFLSVCLHYDIATIVHRQYVETFGRSHTAVRHDPPRRRGSSAPTRRALSALPVCVTLTNFACTGRNVAMVVAGEPSPCATGAPHVLPSIDTCTL